MKRIWARVGMSLEISDEEYEGLKKQRDESGNLEILECDSDLNLRFAKDGYPDGETYIPASVFYDIDEYGYGSFEGEPETKKRTIVAINDDGTIDGYLSTAEYAKEVYISAIEVRRWIREGRLDSLAIANGTRRTGVVHFIKQGTPRPKLQKRGRKKGEQANGRKHY